MTKYGLGPLLDGGRAVVIGGGPGGMATAIALKKGARALGRDVRVTLVEGKQFVGEQHHNQCVGVLSPPIMDLLEHELEVPFPKQLIRGVINGYVLHTNSRSIVLDGEVSPSFALRRIQFDAYMLDAARERGVEVVSARVTGLEFHDDRVVIYTENLPLEADVVVGAFGLDEGTAVLFNHATGYRPPPAITSIVTKYHPGETTIERFGNHIQAFLPTNSRIEFGAITPKGNHITINVAGTRIDSKLMETFLKTPQVRGELPSLNMAGRLDKTDLQFFRGAFPCGLAGNFSGDRFVMVGDASGLVRAFKGKGVTTAIRTGMRAADVMLCEGISERAFLSYHRANRDITDDMLYGKVIRFLTILGARIGLMELVVDAAEKNAQLRCALFDAVSADQSYRHVVGQVLTPGAIKALAMAMGRAMKRVVAL